MAKFGLTIKRGIDLVGCIVMGPLVLFVSMVIAIMIRLTSGPGILFRQERAGQNMRPFTLYKFRTMRNNTDPFGPSPKGGDDPRLTRVGRWLRASSLDELPQLLNVLRGDMSLVGPRPLYMEQARQWDERQRRRVLVKPGLTGLAQISGRGGLTIEDKIELDLQYVERQSLGLDAKIMLATALSLFHSKDIYEKKYSRTQDTRAKR